MKNSNQNLNKTIFILSCLLWGFLVVTILIGYFQSNTKEKIENETQPKIIEKKDVYYSELQNSNSEKNEVIIEDIPFFEISDTDRYIIECVVAGESKGESLRGKKLVAQCIMNAMIRNNWDAETVRIQYQYAGWEPELKNKNPEVWAEVELAVSEVFDEGNLETYESILYFYAPAYSSGSWHENNLEYVLTEGGHKFFKLPGE